MGAGLPNSVGQNNQLQPMMTPAQLMNLMQQQQQGQQAQPATQQQPQSQQNSQPNPQFINFLRRLMGQPTI